MTAGEIRFYTASRNCRKEDKKDKKTVCVGMSGGVDSSVAAYLLKEQGYNVIGVTMQIWQDEDADQISEHGGCCGLSAVDDARRVAAQLEIPYYVMNFKEDFRKYVIDYFVDEYRNGRTPNPCIACNRYVKWESLLRRSLSIGGDYIATGHYARVEQLSSGRYTLRVAKGIEKDQTYALYNLTQDQLSKTLMPVGEYNKTQSRQIAADIGIQVANKPDSQEICFLPDGDYVSFIEKYATSLPPRGDMLFEDGIKIGKHEGIYRYTIGQRKGLGSFGKPVFVRNIDARHNTVTIGDDLYTNVVFTENFTHTCRLPVSLPIEVTVKIRSRAKEAPAVAEPFGNGLKIIFSEPQRAVTPGQSAVLYKDDVVVGGGIIKSTEGDCHEI